MSEDNFSFSTPQKSPEITEGETLKEQALGEPAPKASKSRAKDYDLSKAVPLNGVYFLPEGALPAKPWRKRHPWIFRLMLLCLFFFIWAGGSALYGLVRGSDIAQVDTLGVVRIDGMILDSEKTIAWIDKLRENKKVRGVLLRINSPGGAVVPSQEIFQAVTRLANTKPVVVSMSSAAASGGYYIAIGAHHIIANPSTLTGSIGVRMGLVNMQELMDVLGIKQQGLASGAMKEAGTPYRPMRDDERAYLQSMVDDMYEAFIEEVALHRELDIEYVRKLADGRAYTGRQALEVGLVDELGDYSHALNVLTRMSGLPRPPEADEYLVGPPSKQSWLLDLVDSALERLGAVQMRQQAGHLFYY